MIVNLQRVGRTTLQILLFQAGTLVSIPTLVFALMFLWGISILLSTIGLNANGLMPQLFALNPAVLILAVTLVYGIAYLVNVTSDAFEDFNLEKISSALISFILIAGVSVVIVIGESQVLPYTVGMLMLRILSAVLTLFGVAYLFESRGGFYLEFLRDRASLTRGLLSIIGVALTSVVSSSFLTSGNLLISRDAGLLAGTVVISIIYFFFRKVPFVGLAIVSLIISLCTFVVQPEKLLAVFAVASGTLVTNQCEVKMLEEMRIIWTKRQIMAFYFCAVIFSFIWAYFHNNENWWVILVFGLIFTGLGKIVGLSPTQWGYFFMMETEASFSLGHGIFSALPKNSTNPSLWILLGILISISFGLNILPEIFLENSGVDSTTSARGIRENFSWVAHGVGSLRSNLLGMQYLALLDKLPEEEAKALEVFRKERGLTNRQAADIGADLLGRNDQRNKALDILTSPEIQTPKDKVN